MTDDDETLCQQGMGRIGDLYTKSEDFEVFEKEITKIMSKIVKKIINLNIRKFLTEIGNNLYDDESILKQLQKRVSNLCSGINRQYVGLTVMDVYTG